MIRGIDVSAAQGRIQWNLVPDWVQFCIIKVSEGSLGLDPLRKFNMDGCEDRGILWGAYHFFRSSQDPEGQAERLWQAVGGVMPAFVCADAETIADGLNGEQYVGKLLRLVAAIQDRFGRPPMLYTYPWFARSVVGSALAAHPEIARCPLWMADYSGGETPAESWRPFTPAPWTAATMAQTSGNNSTHVPGIVGAVDHDVYFGDAASFRHNLLGLPDPEAPTVPSLPVPASPYDDPDDAA